jgi:cytochrome c553
MSRMALSLITLLSVAPVTAAFADEASLALKDDVALATVRARCSVCHSVDYIQMNAPFMKRAAWEQEVLKMIKVMGAPVPDQEVATIVDYLTKHYGAN